MEYVPDHPVIRNMERTGYPDGKPPEADEYPWYEDLYDEE